MVALQNAEDRGYSSSDRDYGSIGYGGDERGDLSNLQFALEALTLTELDPNSELYAKAKVFLQRTQNLRKVNDFKARVRHPETGEWQTVESGDDGGASYYPGNSPAGYITLKDGTTQQLRADLMAPMALEDRADKLRIKAAALLGADHAGSLWNAAQGQTLSGFKDQLVMS